EKGISYNRISITGSAWIMGRHDFYFNEDDPLNEGYLLIPEIEGGGQVIRKVINSHDIHIGGQQLRIIHKDELTGSVEGFNNIDLLLNEPRGSKYVNLIIYKADESVIEVEIHSNSVLDNKDILLKSFIRSLLERGTINQDDRYVIKEKENTYTYMHDSLGTEKVYEVEGVNGTYVVNDKDVLVETVDFELSIENITQI